jgi:hypothetical protein
MPGPILTLPATVTCPHAGKATPTVPSARVMIMGTPAVTMTSPYAIAGCTFPAMSSGSPPCVTAQFTTGAVRVTSLGAPLLVASSMANTVPNGVPVIVVPAQTRVIAQ